MTTLTEIKDRLAGAARVQGDRYAGDEERPLHGYVISMATYVGLVPETDLDRHHPPSICNARGELADRIRVLCGDRYEVIGGWASPLPDATLETKLHRCEPPRWPRQSPV